MEPTTAAFRLECMDCGTLFECDERAGFCPACNSSDITDALPASWDEDEGDG